MSPKELGGGDCNFTAEEDPKDYAKTIFDMACALQFLVGIIPKENIEFVKKLRVCGAHCFGFSIQFCVAAHLQSGYQL